MLELLIINFNKVVDACARSGELGRIPKLLEDRIAQDIEPNLITYSAILKGYGDANRLDEAFELFKSMREANAFITPRWLCTRGPL